MYQYLRACLTGLRHVVSPVLTLFASVLGYTAPLQANQPPGNTPLAVPSQTFLLKRLNGYHEGSIAGDCRALIEFAETYHKTPTKSHTGKTLLTFNTMGFDVLDADFVAHNWVIQDALAHCGEHKRLLDIGGGYGAITKEALSKDTTVVYNDICDDHLMVGYKNLKPQYRQKVTLNNQPAQALTLPKGSFDAIVAHRVLHFMPPEEVEAALTKFSELLKPNGRLYIVTLSPTHMVFKDKVLADYDQKWKTGKDWPGCDYNSQDLLPNQAYVLPEKLHVMDGRPLERALKKNGFEIFKSDYLSTKHLGNEPNRDGREQYGVIAIKKPQAKL